MAGIAGVYRSEKYVVVERHRHQFPQHCIWCNSVIAEGVAAAAPGSDGESKPPMCGTCKTTRNRRPKTVGIFGVITVVAAPLVYSNMGALVAGALLLTGFIEIGRAHV